MKIKIQVESPISNSMRVRQLSAMFDCPAEEKSKVAWDGELPIEGMEWNLGLIVGPSGCGKSTIANELFGRHVEFEWNGLSVIDDFPADRNMEDISGVCQAVGFNTIPAWMRPYRVLSNGERFRVDLARRLLTLPSPIVCDEFTSVVDRQTAKIGSHAVQKHIRKTGKQFVAVACHYDIVDWLQPDWIFEPATMTFTRRSLQRRPSIECVISRVPKATWRMFSPFHYLTSSIQNAAKCFCLFVDDRPVSFIGIWKRPHPTAKNIMAVSRIVTLPDWQGIGLAMALADVMGSAYNACGWRLRNYPAHPSYVRSLDRSPNWFMAKRPGTFDSGIEKKGGTLLSGSSGSKRPCAAFEYCGPVMDKSAAVKLLAIG